jgi:hypothetical protein
MTTNPGCFPKSQQSLDPSKMRGSARIMYKNALAAEDEFKIKKLIKQGLYVENKVRFDLWIFRVLIMMQLVIQVGDLITTNLNIIIEQLLYETETEETSLLELSDTEKKFLMSVFRNKCRKCETFKPPKSHHCRTCNACIARMDHHCPWVNNWIGVNNTKTFLLFWFYISIGSFYAIAITLINNLHWLNEQWVLFLNPWIIALNIFGLFLALIFGMFTTIMFFDQISWITNETSTIDKLKNTYIKSVRITKL